MPKRRKSGKRSLDSDAGADLKTQSNEAVGCAILIDRPHQTERDVRRELLSQPGLRFSSLVVRRIGRGVFCLEGVLETTSKAPDVCSLAQRVAGVDEVLNHLVVRNPYLDSLDARSN